MAKPLHVAAAVIVNSAGKVLIARRPAHVHQGDLWEFPGGKLEPGEPVTQALTRELEEELGISATVMRPLIRLRHDYPDKSVLLDVWRVDAWRGEPHGRERQPLQWLVPDRLTGLAFPVANRPIITAARLPDHYMITPEPVDIPQFLARLEQALAGGVRLLQLRAKTLPPADFQSLARQALALARTHGATLLLNGPPALLERVDADGVHLPSRELMKLNKRPVPANKWLAASCHDEAELAHARKIGVDFVVLSPLKATASHPGQPTLGWERFAAMVHQLPLPVFALGGLDQADKTIAFEHGAQGVAGIRTFWPG